MKDLTRQANLFVEWWESLNNDNRYNHMSAFERFEKSAKAIKN